MDNAATTYPKPESVYAAVDHFNRYLGGNPGRGSNQQTLEAGSILVEAREALGRLFNIKNAEQIAFTSNITESINIGIKGLLKAGDHVITTSMEHNAVARPLFLLEKQGVEWSRVQCADDGSLDPEDIRKEIKDNTRLICILHASNLCGTIMPVAEVGKIARDNGIIFMVDSAQTAGVLDIDVVVDKIDILTFTGHKGLLGPQGTGGIYLKPGIEINTLKEGGTGSLSEYLEHPDFMPDHLESGTLNTPGIAGLLAGVNYIFDTGIDKIRKHEKELTDMLIDGMKEIKGLTIYGPANSKKQTAAIALNLHNRDCGDLSMNLDYGYQIITRSGLHCTPLAHTTLGTFELGACRLSPGYFSTKKDISDIIKALHSLAQQR